jgi:hypothetical protein
VAAAPRIAPLDRGTAEGAIVIELDRGVTETTVAQIRQALERFPGVWGLLLDSTEEWEGPGFAALVEAFGEAGPALMARAEFGPVNWPAHPLAWTLDCSALLREAPDERELALRLGSPWLPEIRDLVVELEAEQLPPSPAVLAMLEAAIRPSLAYLYAPHDYAYRALLVQHVAATSPNWSVRWMR